MFSAWAQDNHGDDETRTLQLLSESGKLQIDPSGLDSSSSRILNLLALLYQLIIVQNLCQTLLNSSEKGRDSLYLQTLPYLNLIYMAHK